MFELILFGIGGHFSEIHGERGFSLTYGHRFMCIEYIV